MFKAYKVYSPIGIIAVEGKRNCRDMTISGYDTGSHAESQTPAEVWSFLHFGKRFSLILPETVRFSTDRTLSYPDSPPVLAVSGLWMEQNGRSLCVLSHQKMRVWLWNRSNLKSESETQRFPFLSIFVYDINTSLYACKYWNNDAWSRIK